MDFRLTDEQQLLRQTVREFAEAEIRPHVREWDDAQHFPAELRAEAGRAGPDGHAVPRGLRRRRRCPPSTTASASRSWRASIRPSSLSVAAHNGLGPAHIAMFGTDAQKQQWLVPLARGEKLGAWALTEPNAGSDAAATRTTADARRRLAGC